VLAGEKHDPELFQQKGQRLNTAIKQLQSQLQHLTHLLGVQERREQKKLERFETHHQWLDLSNGLQASGRT
jgi:hypothetical protein